MFGFNRYEKAYIAPFATFLGLMALGEVVAKLGEGFAHWAVAEPKYWVYPLQTLVCGLMVARNWKCYSFEFPRRLLLTLGIGMLVLGIWIAPQFLWAAPRLEGFQPGYFGEGTSYAANLVARFLRLVVVVPLVEEIFWRGFLLRYVIHHDFQKVAVGTFDWRSFAVVVLGFCFEHQMADWPAAIAAGALYNLLAYRSKSLSACVLAHAITNLGLGIFVMRTGQWGFW